MVNLSDFVLLTVTDGERYPLLLMTMSSILPNIQNTKWVIIIKSRDKKYWEEVNSAKFKMLKELALINNVVIEIYTGNDNISVASEKIQFIQWDIESVGKMYLMVDDDVLIPNDTLEGIAVFKREHRLAILLSVSQVDVVNWRGHSDWSNKYCSVDNFEKFCDDIGIEHTATHLWKIDYLKDFRAIHNIRGAGVFAVNRDYLISDINLIEELIKWKNGVRGYDVFLQSYLQTEDAFNCYFLLGLNTFHIGLERDFYDEQWKEMKEGI